MPDSPEQRAEKFRIPDEPKKLIKWLEDKRTTAEKVRPDFQPRINLAFTRGHHFVIWDPDTRRLRRTTTRPDDKNAPVRISVNKVGGQVDRLVSKLTKASPVPEARPVSDEEDDIDAAKVGTRILASESQRIGLQAMLQDLYMWVVPVGWAFLQVTWNAKDGPRISDTHNRGEVNVEVVPHFEMILDPAAKGIETARWCIRTIALPPEEVYERYGKVVEGSDEVRTLADEIRSISEFGNKTTDAPRVAVHQFWLRPGAMRDAPNGMVFTWSGNTILDDKKDFPYKHGRLPFVQFNYLPPLGTAYGRTPIDDLIPMQMDYNDARSREATHRRTMNPKLIYPRRSIDPDKITTRMDMIPYDATGLEPKYLEPSSQWLQQHETVMNRADEEMGDRTGLTEAARGQLAGSAAAASVLAQQEAAIEPLGVPAKQLARAVEIYGWQHLMLVRQFWREKRLIRTWSEAGTLEVDRFRGADIGKQLDVRVMQESSLPKSKAGRAELAISLWQNQIIQDPRVLIRMLELPATDVLTDTFNIDVRKAERENGKIKRGDVPEVDLLDNHELHFQTHRTFIMSPEFEEASQDVKNAAIEHITAHQAVMGTQLQPPGPTEEPQGPSPGNINTGAPTPDTTSIAAGLAPSPPLPAATQLAGISPGVAGEQAPVPGIPTDLQAQLTGN